MVNSCKQQEKNDQEQQIEKRVQVVEQLTRQVQNHPDSSPVRMQLVHALDSLGKYRDAIAQVDSMILRDSANNGLWFSRAQLLEKNRDTVSAISSYERALAIYPSLDAQLGLANLLAETKDQRSLAICRSVLRMSVDRQVAAHCHFISGVYYSRTGNMEQAIASFDECIKNDYTYMVAYLEKGFAYFDRGKYKEALAVFDQAITVNNMYADAYYWKAKSYQAMGNKDEAIINYQRSLGLDKDLVEARQALKMLEGS